MGVAALAVGANGSVQKGLTGRREGYGGVEEVVVEVMAGVIGGNEGEEEGLGIGKFVAAEEGIEKGDQGGEGEGDVGLVGLNQLEEGEEGSGVGGEEGGGSENGVEDWWG